MLETGTSVNSKLEVNQWGHFPFQFTPFPFTTNSKTPSITGQQNLINCLAQDRTYPLLYEEDFCLVTW